MIKGIVTTALLLAFVSGSEASAQQTGIGYKPATDADSKRTILLKDFHPEPALHAAVHEIRRAKFPVIDVHTHTNDAVGIGDRVDPKEMVARMDRLNIKTIVILTGMWGDKLQTIIDDMIKPYPGRFVVFTQFDWSKINDPDFSQIMVRRINDSVARGARGLKVLKELGLGVRDATGKLITIDDPRLDLAWEECGRLGIPVLIHVADPEAFFIPSTLATSATKSSSSIPIGASTARSFPPCKSCWCSAIECLPSIRIRRLSLCILAAGRRTWISSNKRFRNFLTS
jgi:predicted TIM-barrel fold metal-dependent hydrolase